MQKKKRGRRKGHSVSPKTKDKIRKALKGNKNAKKRKGKR